MKYWVDGNMLTMDTATQMFKILKQPDRNYLSKVCFTATFCVYVLCNFILHGVLFCFINNHFVVSAISLTFLLRM